MLKQSIGWSKCCFTDRAEVSHWKLVLTLDSSIWFGSIISGCTWMVFMFNRCFLADLSPFGLSTEKPKWRIESWVNGSWKDDKDPSLEWHLSGVQASLEPLSCKGVSDVAGLGESALSSDSRQLLYAWEGIFKLGVSVRTLSCFCCSSIIFLR